MGWVVIRNFRGSFEREFAVVIGGGKGQKKSILSKGAVILE